MPQVDVTKVRAADRPAGGPREVRRSSLRLQRSRHASFMPVNTNNVHSAGPVTPPPIPFWKQVFATALLETREDLRIDSLVRILTGVGAPAAAFLIVAGTTGQPTWAGLVTLGVVLSIGFVVFAGKTFSLPPRMFRALESDLVETASQRESAELEFRIELLDRLATYYVMSHRGANSKVCAGLALPPSEWINGQLLEMGESWSVHDVRGMRCRMSDHACDVSLGDEAITL